ncbi:P3 protein [Panicum distortion mosaic virus]|nr:P3 protein [Panicum distortion mosaic virus]
MSTVVVKDNSNGTRQRRRRGRRAPRRAQPVVVVANSGQPRRRRNRRRNTRRNRRNAGPMGGASRGETLIFTKDNLNGDASGYLTFGPSLSEYPAFQNGMLKAYHEYKITLVTIQFVSEAASTAAGSIAYELDPHCSATSLSSTINKFGITKNGTRTFQAAKINGQQWHDTTQDQFRILYKGSGAKNTLAGSFRITMRVSMQNPK